MLLLLPLLLVRSAWAQDPEPAASPPSEAATPAPPSPELPGAQALPPAPPVEELADLPRDQPLGDLEGLTQAPVGTSAVGTLGFVGGLSAGLLAALALVSLFWPRRTAPRLSPLGRPGPVPWSRSLPPPRVGRQVWGLPSTAARAPVLALLARSLAEAGPVLVLGASESSALAGLPRVLLAEGLSAKALQARARALHEAPALLVVGAHPALPELLAGELPTIALLAPGEARPAGATLELEADPEGRLSLAGQPVLRVEGERASFV